MPSHRHSLAKTNASSESNQQILDGVDKPEWPMANSGWATQNADYSALETGIRREHTALEVKRNRTDNRPSTIDVAIPISTEPRSQQDWRAWWRRYWIFVLAMSILIIGGIIAGAVGGITSAEKASAERADHE